MIFVLLASLLSACTLPSVARVDMCGEQFQATLEVDVQHVQVVARVSDDEVQRVAPSGRLHCN